MATAIVLHNQSLLDFAIQHTGSAQNAFEIAMANNMSLTDQLTAGAELTVPGTVAMDLDIKNYYSSKAIQPATDVTVSSDDEQEQEGISIWGINNDFIVQ
ncbi:hypothetical protein [Epilithonimonas hispanica]|uniref:LysM domain-containing protein n=1 Tax=Epilithonimonas hispanica TaxID=358687 RepID=A0A3D9D088_9FLAO|nr:hypothetical protein [Epilithonimonas hispanica]REC71384.1 hypothetical protein DRF58_06090 [Epilithonimonas hispanica]